MKEKMQAFQNKGYVYVLIDPRDGTAMYVGSTTKPSQRFVQHARDAVPDGTPKQQWIHALKELGCEPIMAIVEECFVDSRKEREYVWMARFREAGHYLLNVDGGSKIYKYVDHVLTRRFRQLENDYMENVQRRGIDRGTVEKWLEERVGVEMVRAVMNLVDNLRDAKRTNKGEDTIYIGDLD